MKNIKKHCCRQTAKSAFSYNVIRGRFIRVHSTRTIIRPFFPRVGVMTSWIPGHDVCCIDRFRDEREKKNARACVGENEREGDREREKAQRRCSLGIL